MSHASPSSTPMVLDASDDEPASMDVETDRPVREPVDRACLCCGSTFPSEWAGERVCRRCKGSNAWRTGSSL